MSPADGPNSGGTLVSVVATNLIDSAALRCKFGTVAAVAATFITPSLLSCTAPAAAAGTVTVEVSNNGGSDYSASLVPFTYYATETISSLSVTHGPMRMHPLSAWCHCFLIVGVSLRSWLYDGDCGWNRISQQC